jgi:hypothetical protein
VTFQNKTERHVTRLLQHPPVLPDISFSSETAFLSI